jgi:hypothetical protein
VKVEKAEFLSYINNDCYDKKVKKRDERMNIAHMLIACCMFQGTRSSTDEPLSPPSITDTLLSYGASASYFFSNLYEKTKLSLRNYSVRVQVIWARWKQNKTLHAWASGALLVIALFSVARFFIRRAEEARLKQLISDILHSGKHSCDLLKEIKDAAKKRNQTMQELFSSFGYILDQLPSHLPLAHILSSLFTLLEQSEQLTQEKIDSITANARTLLNNDQIDKTITQSTEQNKNIITTLSSIAQGNGAQLRTQQDLVSELDGKCQALSTQIADIKKILNKKTAKKEKI